MTKTRRKYVASRPSEPEGTALPEAVKQINARVPASLARRFKIQAIREGLPAQALLIRVLTRYLDEADRPLLRD